MAWTAAARAAAAEARRRRFNSVEGRSKMSQMAIKRRLVYMADKKAGMEVMKGEYQHQRQLGASRRTALNVATVQAGSLNKAIYAGRMASLNAIRGFKSR